MIRKGGGNWVDGENFFNPRRNWKRFQSEFGREPTPC